MHRKPLGWLHGEIKTPPFSKAARVEAVRLECPLRPMPGIGPRCHELRVRDESTSWRIIYRIDADAVLIVEVFAKATRQTPGHLIEACRVGWRRMTVRRNEGNNDGQGKTKSELEAAGWRFGDAADFLNLTDEERQLVELRVALSRAIRRRRQAQRLTQKQLAARLKSSQSRVAKLEMGVGVSLDLMFRALFALGGELTDAAPLESKRVRRKAVRS